MKIPLKNYHKDFCQKKHQIIQINLVLKNGVFFSKNRSKVQIIQINLVLKNDDKGQHTVDTVQIIQINLVLKNISFFDFSQGMFK